MAEINYNDLKNLDFDTQPLPQAAAWQDMLQKRQEFLQMYKKYRFVKKNMPFSDWQKTMLLRRIRRNLWLCYFLYSLLKRHYFELLNAAMAASDPDLNYFETRHGAAYAQYIADTGCLDKSKIA